jgi:ribonuclease HI
MFTDGAWRRKDKAAGAGVVLIYKDNSIFTHLKHLGDVTNNSAELQAILLGLEVIINETGTSTPICVYSDSSYAIGMLTKDWKTRANKQLVEDGRLLVSRFKNIKFKWVKGHSKNLYNKLADTLANIAIDQHFGLDNYEN